MVKPKVVLSPKLRAMFEERMRMLEREHMFRVLATIEEFEHLGAGEWNPKELIRGE